MKLFGISNGTVQAIKDRNRRCRLQFALHPRCDSTTQNDDLGTVFMDGFVDQLAEGRDCSIDVRMCAYTRQLSGLAIFLDKGSDGEILFRSRLFEDMFKGLAPSVSWLPGRLLHVNILWGDGRRCWLVFGDQCDNRAAVLCQQPARPA